MINDLGFQESLSTVGRIGHPESPPAEAVGLAESSIQNRVSSI
jgi:hypothetical protein